MSKAHEIDREFFFDLLSTPSPTGFEEAGQRVWANYVRGYADGVDNDAYGTAWATVRGTGEPGHTVMIEAHADEIGYIIKHVTKEGYLYIDRVGGSDAATGRGRRVRIFGDKGVVDGIIGNTAIHLRKDNLSDEKTPKVHELYVDVGASSADQVAKMGLRVGHPAVYDVGPSLFGEDRVVGRALDNRLGSYIIAQVVKRLSAERPSATVYAVNAVQEEIGGYGAKMVTHRLRPEVALCLDVTHATDTPGIGHELHGSIELGGGPSVQHGTCNHPKVVKRLIDVAGLAEIGLQHESSSRFSGTDTDAIYHSRDGVPSGLVSLPLRYMHSVVEMADLRDVEQVIQLIEGFVRSLRPDDDFWVRL